MSSALCQVMGTCHVYYTYHSLAILCNIHFCFIDVKTEAE